MGLVREKRFKVQGIRFKENPNPCQSVGAFEVYFDPSQRPKGYEVLIRENKKFFQLTKAAGSIIFYC
jgi:hypothetical protein